MDPSYRARNDASLVSLRALVERLTPNDLDRALDDGWTLKAALMHLAFWDRYAAICVNGWQRLGFEPTADCSDPINRAALPEWLAAPPDHVFQAVIAAAEDANQRAGELSEELRTAVDAGGEAWVCQRFIHREEHIEQIERAIA